MEESGFKIAVIGLGIIGGSVAMALKEFKNAKVAGCDINKKTRRAALECGAADFVSADPREVIRDADIVVMCVYPELIAKIVTEQRDVFKRGAVITDVCGIKEPLRKMLDGKFPNGCEYIGGHPMAGKETDGFSSASADLFRGCGYIITPLYNATERGIRLVRSMAEYMGAARITEADAETHDRIIAYTSDLMHVSASALCLNYNKEMNLAYTAGAFRDCTRIANINPKLWSELFIENRENLLYEIDGLTRALGAIRQAIERSDREELEEILETVRTNKLKMQRTEPK